MAMGLEDTQASTMIAQLTSERDTLAAQNRAKAEQLEEMQREMQQTLSVKQEQLEEMQREVQKAQSAKQRYENVIYRLLEDPNTKYAVVRELAKEEDGLGI